MTDEENRDPEADVTHHYHCDLIRDSAQAVRVATYSEAVPAEALAAWLRERLGVGQPAP